MRFNVIAAGIAMMATAWAATPQEHFDAGRYTEAAEQLEGELREAPSAEGYLNVALALQKAGKTAEAVVNYERALLLDPGLSAAKNSLAELAAEKGIQLPPRRWTDDVVAIAHPDTLVALGSTISWVAMFALLFLVLGPRRPVWMTAAAVCSLALGSMLFALGWVADPRLAEASLAVVTSENGADVLTQPAGNSDRIAELPPGTPVGVLSPRGAWTYVDLARGARGWVQTSRLTPVVPGETL
jgi:Tfp pilus assembly protein PilF